MAKKDAATTHVGNGSTEFQENIELRELTDKLNVANEKIATLENEKAMLQLQLKNASRR